MLFTESIIYSRFPLKYEHYMHEQALRPYTCKFSIFFSMNVANSGIISFLNGYFSFLFPLWKYSWWHFFQILMNCTFFHLLLFSPFQLISFLHRNARLKHVRHRMKSSMNRITSSTECQIELSRRAGGEKIRWFLLYQRDESLRVTSSCVYSFTRFALEGDWIIKQSKIRVISVLRCFF